MPFHRIQKAADRIGLCGCGVLGPWIDHITAYQGKATAAKRTPPASGEAPP